MTSHHPITTQKGTPVTPQTCTTCSGDGIDPEYEANCCRTCHGEGELDATAARLAEIRARARAATEGPWRETVLGSEGYDVRAPDVIRGTSRIPRARPVARCGQLDWDADKANAQFIAHARQDVPWLLAEVERLTGERDRARGLAARLEEQVARVEALAVAVDNRMMATAKPAEIWAALRGEGACEGSPLCPGDTHTEGCYSLAWTDAERQQCTDARCLTPCVGCAEAALTGAGGE